MFRLAALPGILLGALLLLPALSPSALAAPMTASAAALPPTRYGTLHLARPQGDLRGVVILFSGADGWGPAEQAAADRLATANALVIGVDSAFYLSHIDTAATACHLMEGDVETITRQLQRQNGQERYFLPILAGLGAGGALAGRVLTLAPVNSVAGAVAIDPQESPAVAALPCGRGATKVNGFWEIGASPAWPADAAAHFRAGPAFTRRDLPAGANASEQLAALVAAHLATTAPEEGSIADLPVVELPAVGSSAGGSSAGKTTSGRLAVVLSGDGGWRDIDRSIAQRLHDEGVSAVGFDSLRYFWSERTPEQTATDLARVLRVYMARWHAEHVALIGYSFGADVLPFVYPLLPEDLRAHVELLSLVALSSGADFEIRVVGWLGAPPSASARPMAPQLQRLPAGVVQCIYSSESTGKDASACPVLAGTAADVVKMPGNHHFNGDYAGLTRHILDAWKARAGTR